MTDRSRIAHAVAQRVGHACVMDGVAVLTGRAAHTRAGLIEAPRHAHARDAGFAISAVDVVTRVDDLRADGETLRARGAIASEFTTAGIGLAPTL